MGETSKTPFILGLIGGVIGFLISIAFLAAGAAFHGLATGPGSASAPERLFGNRGLIYC